MEKKIWGKWDFPHTQKNNYWAKTWKYLLILQNINNCALESQVSMQLSTSAGIYHMELHQHY